MPLTTPSLSTPTTNPKESKVPTPNLPMSAPPVAAAKRATPKKAVKLPGAAPVASGPVAVKKRAKVVTPATPAEAPAPAPAKRATAKRSVAKPVSVVPDLVPISPKSDPVWFPVMVEMHTTDTDGGEMSSLLADWKELAAYIESESAELRLHGLVALPDAEVAVWVFDCHEIEENEPVSIAAAFDLDSDSEQVAELLNTPTNYAEILRKA